MQPLISRLVACLALSLLLTACPETAVPDNFGTAPVRLKDNDWNGQWRPVDDEKETFTFRVKDTALGIIELQESAPKDPKKKPEIFTLTLRDSGPKGVGPKLHFAILKDTAKPAAGTLYLVRLASNGTVFLWSICHDVVTAAIKSGELQGTITPDKDGPHNTLTADPKNYPNLLAPKFWNWAEPTVMVRAK